MKNLKFFAGLLLIPLLITPACDPFELNQDDLQLSVDFSIFNTYFSVNYYDAQTGEIIGISGDTNLDITFTPSVESIVVDTEGKVKNGLSSKFGFFTMALDPFGSVPSAENPISITIVTKSDQYVTHVKTIKIAEERSLSYDVDLINKDTPPSGVIIKENKDVGQASDSGETAEDIVLTTENSEVEVEIESGTVLTDEDGAPLTGSVSVELMSVDVTDEEGFKNVPGLDQPVINEDGSEGSMFSPIAYTKVEITDQNGKKAKGVSGKEMVITTGVSSKLINPGTGQPLAPGDLVPSFYMDEKDNVWKFMGKDPVEMGKNGKMVIKKVIRTFKTGGATGVGQFAYSFDQTVTIDYVIQWTVESGVSLPVELVCTYDVELTSGSHKTGTMNVMIEETTGKFWLYGIPGIELSGKDFSFNIEKIGSLTKDMLTTIDSNKGWTINLEAADFGGSTGGGTGGGTPSSYLVNFKLDICGDIVLSGSSLPNFTAIFSGTGFARETVKLVSGGVITLPIDPRNAGSWQAKIIFNNSYEYPAGSGRISVDQTYFSTETDASGNDKIIFNWNVTDATQCADLRAAIGI